MADKLEVKQGTLALMILRTLEVLGPLHGYGVARRIEEVSKNRLTLNYGTLYPALLTLEQEGFLTGAWRPSETNRRAKVYSLTAAGRKQFKAGQRAKDNEIADLIAAFRAAAREAMGTCAPRSRASPASLLDAPRTTISAKSCRHVDMQTAENIRRGMHPDRAPAGDCWRLEVSRGRGGSQSARTAMARERCGHDMVRTAHVAT
jgi:transcriptional regulator